ncbi:hypothetical protein PHSY_000733 [Pseudozyma hubeiensis SY62]|uniref:Uncharacterized protein n=1 Tax=Pseudozyma hubeiensis (strain SY62) TaxID=1305764 RepID=R9P4X8_PSEHS|nr:hypothetical protein PHSY_000733 [Pseudozyma hubeiensis SY62]GAC93170.1 hypothetical protein PHSY_000733 [Pseudozyma hubeiensis SY62]
MYSTAQSQPLQSHPNGFLTDTLRFIAAESGYPTNSDGSEIHGASPKQQTKLVDARIWSSCGRAVSHNSYPSRRRSIQLRFCTAKCSFVLDPVRQLIVGDITYEGHRPHTCRDCKAMHASNWSRFGSIVCKFEDTAECRLRPKKGCA